MKKPDLREQIEAKGRTISWVADQLKLTTYSFTFWILNRARPITAERRELAKALQMKESEVEAALEETARRWRNK